jgi:hypothetical protein
MAASKASLIATFLLAGVCGICQQPVPRVYVSMGACPFECCRYGKWVANRRVVLLDHPGGRPVAKVAAGEQVLAITGEVITRPVRFQVRRDGPYDDGVPAGSAVYLLHPLGEGFWLVWYKGKPISIDPAYDGPEVAYQWWARVRIRSGRIGWVRMSSTDLAFNGVDGCS